MLLIPTRRGPTRGRATRSAAALLTAVAAAVVPVALVPTTAGAAPPGTVADCTPYQLPGLPGSDGSGNVMWITDSGLYVGSALRPDGTGRSGWWTHAGSDLSTGWTFHTVPGLDAVDSSVLDANTAGVMVGYDYSYARGYVFDSRSGSLTWLPDLVGGQHVFYARRINATGEVAGGAADRNGNEVAAVWSPPYSQATRLPDVGGSQSAGTQQWKNAKMFSEADGINDLGQAAGTTALGAPIAHESAAARGGWLRGGIAPLYQGVVWQNPGVQRLPAGEAQSLGFAIDDAGTVVGASDRPGDPTYNWYPAAWIGGKLRDLGAGPDTIGGFARGISRGGWAAGGVDLADGTGRAFVWTGVGSLQELRPVAGQEDSGSHAVNDQLRQVGGDSATGDAYGVPTVWQCPVGFTTG